MTQEELDTAVRNTILSLSRNCSLAQPTRDVKDGKSFDILERGEEGGREGIAGRQELQELRSQESEAPHGENA